MHPSAYELTAKLVAERLDRSRPLQIAEIGSYNVNGSIRPLFDAPSWRYTGLDLTAGPGVDVVLPAPYEWPALSGAFDVVVSVNTLEHIPAPWRWIRAVGSILRFGGLLLLIAPNTWEFHEYPVDCWRVWPDGLRALFDEARIETLDAGFEGRDTWGVGRAVARCS